MKQSILFSAAILLSTVTFAQTTVTNQEAIKSASSVQTEKGKGEVTSTGSATSTTNLKTDAVKTSPGKVANSSEKVTAEIAAEKQAIEAQVVQEINIGEKTAAADVTASATTQSMAGVDADAKGNKTTQNASLDGETNVSAAVIQNNATEVKKDIKTTVNTGAETVVEVGSQVMAKVEKVAVKSSEKINAGTGTAVKATTSTVHAVKPVKAVKISNAAKTRTAIRLN